MTECGRDQQKYVTSPRYRLEMGTSAHIPLARESGMVKPRINKDRKYILPVVGGTIYTVLTEQKVGIQTRVKNRE